MTKQSQLKLARLFWQLKVTMALANLKQRSMKLAPRKNMPR